MTLDEAIAALAVAERERERARRSHAAAAEVLKQAHAGKDSAKAALDNIIAEQIALHPH